MGLEIGEGTKRWRTHACLSSYFPSLPDFGLEVLGLTGLAGLGMPTSVFKCIRAQNYCESATRNPFAIAVAMSP